MAIDDNTSYELTGAQVKDLASKINAKADTTDLPSVMTGATSSTAGASGLVPAPAAGDEAKVLSGAGTWVNQSGGGGSSSVTYYAASSSTQGFSTYYTYLYSDTARTTVVTPDTILSNFENGDTILIEFESTGTGSSAYKMTLTVTTMTLDGDDVYRMTVIELNEYNTTYNCVTACLSAAWDGQSSFNGRWGIVRNTRPVVNDGTLTIQQNGTTVGTFTANQNTDTTVNLAGGVYADDPTTSANPDAWVTSSDVDWSTMTPTLTSQSTTGTNFNMSWKKRVYSNGEIEWFGTGQVYVQQAQHSAATVITTLPVSYDWTKMVLISNAYSDQRMFIYNAVPSGTTLTIGVGNTWTATVDGDVHVNVYIKQY